MNIIKKFGAIILFFIGGYLLTGLLFSLMDIPASIENNLAGFFGRVFGHYIFLVCAALLFKIAMGLWRGEGIRKK